MKALCIFCGSSAGARPEYVAASHTLAEAMFKSDLSLVYGGAHVGIMGAVADQLLSLGGKVYGVIPEALVDLEVAHDGLTELHVVEDMHQRKAKMAELADGFVALPGGLGTLEELFEVLTWAQLGIHSKPVGLLNVSGFYDGLLEFLDKATTELFMRPGHRELLMAEEQAPALLQRFASFQPVTTSKLPLRP